jgi:hypothetical protein
MGKHNGVINRLKVADAQFGIACVPCRQRRNPSMKLSSILIPAAASLLLAACNSLDNPITNLFHGVGRDERVYNSQTGQWEWPSEKRKAQEKKSAAVASALATPAPHGFNDTRYWDPQRNQWVEAEEPRTPSQPKPKPTPPAAGAAVAMTTAQTDPPPPPRASHATGVYNSSTGKIDWQTSGEYVPPPPPPAPKKHWYWPF